MSSEFERKVRDVARLHSKTVEDHHKHIKGKVRGARKAANRVQTMKVDPRVWKKALQIAQGDRSKIIVLSETEVVVTNHSKRKQP